MALQEAGQAYPMQDGEWLRAHEMAFGEAEAPSWSPKNDVPTRNPEDVWETTVRKAQVGIGLATATGGATAAAAGGTDPILQHIQAFEAVGAKLITLATPANATIVLVGAAAYAVVTVVLPKLGIGK